MSRRVIFSPRAEAHLDSIHHYIVEQSGPSRADAFVERLIKVCESLADFPERGIRRDDLYPNLRVMGFRRQVSIAFTFEDAAVIIQGVLGRGRDLARAFNDEEQA